MSSGRGQLRRRVVTLVETGVMAAISTIACGGGSGGGLDDPKP